MSGARRLTIRALGPDPRSAALTAEAHALGVPAVERIDVADLVFIDADLADDAAARLHSVLVEPQLQEGDWEVPAGAAVETALHPGVTDAAAAQVLRAARLLDIDVREVATGTRYEITGSLTDADRDRLVQRLLTNPVIERWSEAPIAFVPAATGEAKPVEIVPIRGLDDGALAAINAERGLALDPNELRVIVDHFTSLGRDPTDVELETLAQTWSEHCAHKTFRARIRTADGAEITPLLQQLRRATEAIAAPFLRSAFVGNAGIVSFVQGTTIAVKAETHNHPSAIEPFGGANTGVGGVIRDIMGAAHHPIACTDILCFGPTDLAPDALPDGVLHPLLVEQGVVEGVADYGNKIGLPTVAGAVLYDPGYIANPLVFCGCIGIADEGEPLTGPHPGDLVVVLGGRTGRDGLRGATFSSATMDATTGDVAGASVQIGDPITEKLLIDLLRDAGGLYTAITDCGAGGLSSAIGEMAEHVGADVDLSVVPLKYAGLGPWEVWLSEAQERMVIAVAPGRWSALCALADRHGVEATSLGTFTGDGVLRVRYGDETVLSLDTEFLHDGRPQREMVAVLPEHDRLATQIAVADPIGTLLALLAHPDIASKERIVRRYDHEILGTSVVRPQVGVHHDAPADGVVLARPSDTHGIAIGIGVNPRYGEIDPEWMAHAVVDEAVRNVVAVGADPDAIALLDNFSWGDPRRDTTLGALAAAVHGCVEASLAYRAPFVSGKDSLNNEYQGPDGQRRSVPPTLVITAVAHVPDANKVVTPDLKRAGSTLVLIGDTAPEFGGSHAALVLGTATDSRVPAPDPDAPARYRRLHAALRTGRILSCHDVSDGGLAVALAEMAIGGRLGIDVTSLPHSEAATALFSQSNGRFVVEVDPNDVEWFVEQLDEPVTVLGNVMAEPTVRFAGVGEVSVDQLVTAFTGGAR